MAHHFDARQTFGGPVPAAQLGPAEAVAFGLDSRSGQAEAF